MHKTVLFIIKNNDNNLINLFPRASLTLSIHLFILNKIKSKKNIKIYHNDQELFWYLPIGVIYDIIKNKINTDTIELTYKESEFNDIFDPPILNSKIFISQRFKHGFATIFNSAKKFLSLNHEIINNHIEYSIQYNLNKNKSSQFNLLMDEIYNNNLNDIRIPIIFHLNNEILFYSPKFNNNLLMKDIINNFTSNNNTFNNDKFIINGLSYDNYKNIPVIFAMKNLCYSDLFIHIVII